MTTLRDYQHAVKREYRAATEQPGSRVLMVAPTGSGKTVVAADIIREDIEAGATVLFLAHRRELIQQTQSKLYDLNIDAGIIQAGWPTRPGVPVQVASIQTLHARAVRSSRMETPPADLVVVDEAHHVRAKTYLDILAAYPSATVLGMTATPCRGDGRGLGNVFQTMIHCPSVGELVKLGYLVPSRIYAPTIPDLQGVRTQAGDFNQQQLAERMDNAKLVGDIVTHWHRLAEKRPTVIFASGVAHSIHLRDEFRLSGVRAEHIDGGTAKDERDAILARLCRREIDLVSNCAVLTEGWDSPAASCAVLARPTKQIGLYLQTIGRVLRPAEGKQDALILDHSGAVFRHGFPDDEIAWTLDTDRRAENRSQASRSETLTSRLTTCPECSAIRTGGEGCNACGWTPKRRAESVDVADGELGEVARDRRVRKSVADAQERDRWHRELAYIARDRGYKAGWIAHKFKEKFGQWPPYGHVHPAPPRPEVASWVRSRMIAFAKASAAS